MGPVMTAAIPAAIEGAVSAFGARRQNKAAQAAAREQMAFQERMSSTAHQREVADLRAAGLNPILSGTGGAGASSPSGAMPNVVDELGGAVSSARQSRLAQNELKTAALQRVNMGLQGLESIARTNLTREQAENVRANTALIAARTPREQAIGDAITGIRSWLEKTLGGFGNVSDAATSAVDAIKSIPETLRDQVTPQNLLKYGQLLTPAGAISKLIESAGSSAKGALQRWLEKKRSEAPRPPRDRKSFEEMMNRNNRPAR